MRKLTVNLPETVVQEVSGMDQSQMVALGQAISMYPWLGELLHCVGLEAQRQRWLDQQYDLGESKHDIREKWDVLDRTRCDTYDAQFDGRGRSIGLGVINVVDGLEAVSTENGIRIHGKVGVTGKRGACGGPPDPMSKEDDELGRAWHPGWSGLSLAEKVECLGRMKSD